jgi:CHAD domain-containing protein
MCDMTAAPAGAVVEYVRAQRDAIIQHEPGVRAGDEDAVHDMRVAIRRLRSTLRSFRSMWDRSRVDALREELKWLADQLGAVRDGQVMAARLREAVRAEPLSLIVGPVEARVREHLSDETSTGLERLYAVLDGDRYARLLADLEEFLGEEPEAGGGWVYRRVRKAVSRADRMLDVARSGDSAPIPGHERDSSPLHEARKAYKRARYAVEAVGPSAGGKAPKRLVKRLKALQDVLGAQQDTVITRTVLRDLGMRAYRDGENAFTYGLLHARQRDAGEQALRDLPTATARARRRKLRRWLS